MNPRNNPNAAIAVQGTGLGVLLVYGLGLAGVSIPDEVAAAIAGTATVAMLWVGVEGLRAIPARLWRGSRWYEENK
jgi:hypothetical protein